MSSKPTTTAEIVREYGPFGEGSSVAGGSWDGTACTALIISQRKAEMLLSLALPPEQLGDDPVEQPDEGQRRNRVGATAAKGDPRDPAAAAEMAPEQIDLLVERIQIDGYAAAAIGRARVASAIPAYFLAVGNVDIQGELRLRRK